MGLLTYLGFVALAVVVAVAVHRFQPASVARLARRTGIGGRVGWAAFSVAVLWVFLPVLAGAETGGEEAWVLGAAVAGVGCYLVVVAGGSLDEYRLLAGVEHRDPQRVTPGEPVATAGVPTADDGARTPLTDEPGVHTDWLVQRRRWTGLRRTWTALASGVQSTPFTLGDGTVRVEAGEHRVVSNAERMPAVDPDDPLPDAAASFLREHPDLPDPDDREHRLRFLETYVPADEPVTVVGTPRQGEAPGTLVVDEAPPDDVLGTHGGGDTGEAVLVRGDADDAETTLRKRVYWLGPAGLAMALGGQALSFVLSSASPALLL